MVVGTTSSSSSSSNKEGNWGMGFLLVFFHHHTDEEPSNCKRRQSFSLSSVHSKTQSTLSICGLLVFTTIFFFTLSTFEPTSATHHHHRNNRRVLHQVQIPQNAPPKFSVSRLFGTRLRGSHGNFTRIGYPPALQGMGVLFRKGSKAMTDLVVGHVAEGATEREVTSFFRLIHHSGLLSRSDLALIFDSPESASRLGPVVKSECDSFLRLVSLYRELNLSRPSHGSGSGLTRYLRPVGEEDKEALWGKRGNFNFSRFGELTRVSYGSVVGFDSSELDPENSLSGFLDRVQMGLRRWACYPMLLGRVRRHFKHTMLVDIQTSLVLSDPFTPIRNRSAESVLVWPNSDDDSTRRVRRNSVHGAHFNPALILGGGRGVRRFATAALTEIVRAVIEHKGKARNSVSESGLVNQLVHSGHLLKNINLITQTESIPDASSLAGFNSLDSAGSGFLAFSDYFTVVRRGRSSSGGGVSGNIDIDSIVKREICLSHELYSSVYRDCLATQ